MKIEPSFNPLPQMGAESSKRDKTLAKIATAIEIGMQDSSSRSITDSLQNQISTMSQDLMNNNDGISMMQIAGGTLNSLSDQTQTLNDLSVQYNNATLNDSQKQALQGEFAKTVQSMQQSISSSTYNGNSLFGSNLTLGNGSISTSIPTLSPTSLSITNQDSIQSYQDSLAQAGSNISSTTNALMSSTDNFLNQITTTAAAKSQSADTDIASAVQEYQQSNLKLDASQIATAHLNSLLKQNISQLVG
jgi:flagellin